MGLVDRARRTCLRGLAAAGALGWLRRGAAASGWSARPRRDAPVPGPGPSRDALGPDTWDEFRRRFVTGDGRVVDDDGSTHSEGLGTALLASASVGDRDGFERVWNFARALRRDDGLFSWRLQQGGRVVDANNATDGDLYIAWALARAARRFDAPALARDARQIARAIRTHCVRDGKHGPVIVPGRFGFDRVGRVIANPSYWVFPAFEELASVDPHPLWKATAATSLALLARAQFGSRRLTGDWIELESGAAAPWHERPARFGYEAIRVPLFLYWGRHSGHPQLQAFTRHAAAPAFPAWVALDSDEVSSDRAPAGFEAIARLARTLPAITRARLPYLGGSYYSSSLILLAALANDDVIAEERQLQGASDAGRRAAGPAPAETERVGFVP
jgi:endo-1,4-beta-D-glucanase Y